jgi:hypothetical protein
MKKIDTLHNNFFEKMTNFTSKNLGNLIFTVFFFSMGLVTIEGLFYWTKQCRKFATENSR